MSDERQLSVPDPDVIRVSASDVIDDRRRRCGPFCIYRDPMIRGGLARAGYDPDEAHRMYHNVPDDA